MADPKPGTAPQGSRQGTAAGGGGTVRGETIVFQCPNGHRISVPVKLAGKRGACSKCGTAVVIPAATADVAPPATKEGVTSAGGAAAGEDPPGGEEGTITLTSPAPWVPPAAPLEQAVSSFPTPEPSSAPRLAGAARVDASAADALPGMLPLVNTGENATALLVARLWAEREHGGIVELHLVGGSVILPMWYEPRWSLGTHGLFASQAADGTVTLTAVAWESVQKVVVRQVEGLPDGMFE